MTLRVDYLNHASMLLELGPYRLLSDPWFEGEAFAGGWGLCYTNPDALAVASRATHLWISHWHSDHLHAPSLQALARKNPELRVLANVSANFSMVERMRAFGFRNVQELGERTPFALGPELRVTRFPTAGIDNALLVQGLGWSILNFNDCNLTAPIVRALRSQTGPTDLLLANYNHAGKLFERRPAAEEKDWLWTTLLRLVDLLEPTTVVPFASSHYYRTPFSRAQNESLLGFDDLEARARGDARFVIMRIGDTLELEREPTARRHLPRTPALPHNQMSVQDYGPSVAWDDLIAAADERCRLLRRGFPLVRHVLPALRVRVIDHDRVLVLDAARGGHVGLGAYPHIACYSRAVHDWLGRRFGDDTFTAGAHFELVDRDTRVIERWALLTLLEASHLTPRDALHYLVSREGLWFLYCRREEILASITGGRLKAARIRLE